MKLSKIVDTYVGTYNEWKNINQCVSELNNLNDRELKDIGVKRGDIRQVARETARRIRSQNKV